MKQEGKAALREALAAVVPERLCSVCGAPFSDRPDRPKPHLVPLRLDGTVAGAYLVFACSAECDTSDAQWHGQLNLWKAMAFTLEATCPHAHEEPLQ